MKKGSIAKERFSYGPTKEAAEFIKKVASKGALGPSNVIEIAIQLLMRLHPDEWHRVVGMINTGDFPEHAKLIIDTTGKGWHGQWIIEEEPRKLKGGSHR